MEVDITKLPLGADDNTPGEVVMPKELLLAAALGLLLCPRAGLGGALILGSVLFFDPTLSPDHQREAVLGALVDWVSEHDQFDFY